MIFRVMCVFLIMAYSAKGLPFSNMNYRPEGSSKTDRSFHRHRSIFYPPFLRRPVQHFSKTSSGHLGSPIRRPVLEVSDVLNQMLEKFDSSLLSRSTPIPPTVFFDQYLRNIIHHQETSQRIKQFGEQGKDTVHHYERYDGERFQHTKKVLNERFRFNEMQKRLQQIFRKKTSLMTKLHSMRWPRWRGKYVGIPYHTMNDDHIIVKKPGADFYSFFQPNIQSPAISTSVSAIRSLTTQYPGVPEVTTSVDLHREWEVPEIIAGTTFPITSIATYRPEVTESTEITNSIGQEKFRKPQLSSDASNRYTGTSVATTISTDPAKVSTPMLESNIIKIPLNGTNEPAWGMQEAVVKDESFVSEMINLDTTTEIGSTSSSPFPHTSQKETNEFPIYETPMLVDLLSGIQAESVTSSVIDQESTTTKVAPTFPCTVTIVEEQFATPMIDNEITVAENITTFPSTLSTDTILGTAESSSQVPVLDATMTADEISTIMDTASTGPEIDPGATSVAAYSVLSTISTDRPITTKFISHTIDAASDGSAVEKNINTRIVLSSPTSTMSPETTSWPLSTSKTISRLEISSKFGDDSFSSFLDEVETPPVTSPSNETITMLTEILTTFDPYNDNSTIEVEGTAEIISTFPSTFSTETSITRNEKSTTAESFPGYNSAASNEKTSEFLWRSLPTTTSPKTTLGRLQNSEMTSLSDVVSRFKYDHFSTSINEVETTFGYDSTLPNTIPATMATDILTTIDPSIDNSITKIEVTVELIPTVAFPISLETSTVMEEKSTTIDPCSSYNSGKITTEIVSLSSSTILPEATPELLEDLEMTPLPDVSSRIYYDRFSSFTDEVETTSEDDSTVTHMIPAEELTMTTEELTTVDPSIHNSTTGMQITVEMVPTVTSTISPETSTIMSEEPTTTDSFSIYNTEKTTTESMTLPSSTISPEITPGLLQDFEMTPLFDASSRFGYDRSPNTVDEVEITKRVYSTLASTISSEAITTFEETSTTTDSHFDSSTIDEGLTVDVLSTFSTNTAPTDFEVDTLPGGLQEFGYNYFTGSTIAPETITGVELTLISTIPTETTKMTIDKLTTIDSPFNNLTIDMVIITENVSALPSTIPTRTPITSDEISTTIDPASKSFLNDGQATSEIDFLLPSTIFPETTSYPPSALIIASPVVVLSRFGYDRFPSFTHMGGETSVADVTPHSTIQTETTATAAERLTTDNRISINSTDDTEKKTEIVSTSPSIISTKTTTTLDGKSLFNSSTFPATFPAPEAETPVSETFTLMDALPGFEYNYDSADPIMTSEKTMRVDSISSSTIPAETATTVTERFATSSSEDSTLEDTVTIFPTIISTETNTSLEEISRATDPASDGFTVNGEATTEIASSLPTTISSETTTMPAITEQSFEYLERNRANGNKRNGRLLHANLEAWAPGFAHHYEEQLDEKTLLNLIPLIIEELRQDKVTPEEEHALSQVFGDLWPLLKEESKRRHGELMNHELAIFLSDTGHGISNTRMHLKDVATDDYEKKSNHHGGSMENIAEFLATLPEIRAPVGSEKVDREDKEHRAQDDGSDYNNKYYYHHNENTERFSRHNNGQGSNIIELLRHSQGTRLAKNSAG